jgi:hypothetical protein
MSLEALKRIKENPLYARIISYFVHRSDEDDNIRAVYIIGSLAQKDSHPTKYSDLDITPDDVMIYKKIRPKFMNASKTITQEVISDMIEVVIDEQKGVYEKLKDKTRSDAISDVKRVYKEWCKDNGENSEVSKKIIWKND